MILILIDATAPGLCPFIIQRQYSIITDSHDQVLYICLIRTAFIFISFLYVPWSWRHDAYDVFVNQVTLFTVHISEACHVFVNQVML